MVNRSEDGVLYGGREFVSLLAVSSFIILRVLLLGLREPGERLDVKGTTIDSFVESERTEARDDSSASSPESDAFLSEQRLAFATSVACAKRAETKSSRNGSTADLAIEIFEKTEVYGRASC